MGFDSLRFNGLSHTPCYTSLVEADCLLQFGGFLMVGGRLGDVFEHKFILQVGMSLFNIATLVCGVVPNKIGLVVGRAFQGKNK